MIDRKVILDNVIKALPEDHDLVPLPKLNVPTPAGMGFQKVYFGARCDCGTSAVLSVEVANDRTEADLESAMPAILDRLMQAEIQLQKNVMPVPSKPQVRPIQIESRSTANFTSIP